MVLKDHAHLTDINELTWQRFHHDPTPFETLNQFNPWIHLDLDRTRFIDNVNVTLLLSQPVTMSIYVGYEIPAQNFAYQPPNINHLCGVVTLVESEEFQTISVACKKRQNGNQMTIQIESKLMIDLIVNEVTYDPLPSKCQIRKYSYTYYRFLRTWKLV